MAEPERAAAQFSRPIHKAGELNQAAALAAPVISPLSAMCTVLLGLPSPLPIASTFFTMSIPSMTAQHKQCQCNLHGQDIKPGMLPLLASSWLLLHAYPPAFQVSILTSAIAIALWYTGICAFRQGDVRTLHVLPLPKTTWRPSNQLVTTVVMKNLQRSEELEGAAPQAGFLKGPQSYSSHSPPPRANTSLSNIRVACLL